MVSGSGTSRESPPGRRVPTHAEGRTGRASQERWDANMLTLSVSSEKPGKESRLVSPWQGQRARTARAENGRVGILRNRFDPGRSGEERPHALPDFRHWEYAMRPFWRHGTAVGRLDPA